jgi:hypothetical protein
MKRFSITLGALALCGASMAFAAPGSQVLRLTLDAVSTVSFDDRVFIPIPSGTLALRSYPSDTPGAVALRVDPKDFGTRTFTLDGLRVSTELAKPATGFARKTEGGALEIELETVFRITAVGKSGRSQELALRFTTESLEAFSANGSKKLNVKGARLDPSSRVVQLVAKTVAPENTGPVPGAPVYIVLSGVLDRLPGL